ncbi:MAG: helix-turn-helix domain-containing protein [Actinomycetaceae bacterium]|nr:helix-turn-helix domain-containing protein [Actinomycetaceae bacterium]
MSKRREELEAELREAQERVNEWRAGYEEARGARRAVVLRAREAGLSYPQIGKIMGVSHQLVQNIAKSRG